MSETGHFSRLSKELSRFLKDYFQLDLDIITGDKKVSVHAFVFAVFSSLFRLNSKDSKVTEIQAKAFKEEEVIQMVKFLYNSDENIPCNTREIIKALNLDLIVDEKIKQKRASKLRCTNQVKSAELKCLRDLTFELTVPKFLDPTFFACDLSIRTGRDVHKCHKVIVCASSIYFELMLTSGMKESQAEIIHLQGIETGIFKSILQYMYTGQIQLTTENVQDLLSTSVYLQIQALQILCEEFLLHQIDKDNCIDMWLFANTYDCKTLADGAWQYMLDNFCAINKPKFLNDLSSDDLCLLLQDSDLNVRSEIDVVKFVLDWSKKHVSTANDIQIKSMFNCCRFKLLEESEIEDILEKCTNARFSKILIDILSNQMSSGKEVLQRKEKTFLVIKRSSYTTGIEAACYSLSNKTWYSLKTNTRCEGGTGFACCTMKDSLLVTGGTASPKYVTQYLVNEDKWINLPDMLEGRSSHAIGHVNGFVYVLGGSDLSTGSFNIVASIEKYSTADKHWTKEATMEIPTYDSAFAVVKTRIYIFGGSMGVLSGVYIKDIQCFDTITNTCSKIYYNLPTTLSLADACVNNTDVYITCPNGAVIHFNENRPPTKINQTGGSNLMGYSTLYCDNSVFIMGGYSLTGETDGIQKYDLTLNKEVKFDAKLPFRKQSNELFVTVMHISRKFLTNIYPSAGEKLARKMRALQSPR